MMITSPAPAAQLGIRAVTPLAIVAALYLLFAGHNQPGGGFAAGLVFGAIVSLRVVAGLQQPRHAMAIIATGITIVTATAAAPLLAGKPLLDQQIASFTLPLLGKIKTGSALPFDIGVTAIVVGLIIALLDGLGATELTATEPDETPTDVSNGDMSLVASTNRTDPS
jgi:multicomponent Na+:H+ antiporter subunit A